MSINWNFRKLFGISIVFVVAILIGLMIGILLGIIGRFIFAGLTSSIGIDHVSLITSAIMTLATIILTIITGWYAKTTYDLFYEQRKSKEIKSIENKLEKLYIPLKFCLKNNSEIKLKTFSVKDLMNIRKCLENISPYSYLASSTLRFPLDSFIEIIGKDAPIIVEETIKEMYNKHIQSKENYYKGDIETEIKKRKEFFELYDIIPKDNNLDEVIQKNIDGNHKILIKKYNEILIIIEEEIPQLITDHNELIFHFTN